MKYQRYQTTRKFVEAAVYQPGMEDGWELKGTFYAKDGPVPRSRDRAPAVRTFDGWRVVYPSDYVVMLPGGDKEVWCPSEFMARYEAV